MISISFENSKVSELELRNGIYYGQTGGYGILAGKGCFLFKDLSHCIGNWNIATGKGAFIGADGKIFQSNWHKEGESIKIDSRTPVSFDFLMKNIISCPLKISNSGLYEPNQETSSLSLPEAIYNSQIGIADAISQVSNYFWQKNRNIASVYIRLLKNEGFSIKPEWNEYISKTMIITGKNSDNKPVYECFNNPYDFNTNVHEKLTNCNDLNLSPCAKHNENDSHFKNYSNQECLKQIHELIENNETYLAVNKCLNFYRNRSNSPQDPDNIWIIELEKLSNISSEANYDLGTIFESWGDVESAIFRYTKALDMGKDDAYDRMLNLLVKNKDYSTLIECIKKYNNYSENVLKILDHLSSQGVESTAILIADYHYSKDRLSSALKYYSLPQLSKNCYAIMQVAKI